MTKEHGNAALGRKQYTTPRLVEHGSIENITGWIGGPWGEFFSGQGSGWNPWEHKPDGGWHPWKPKPGGSGG